DWLQEESDALNFFQLRLKAPDNLGGGDAALVQGLEVNLYASGVDGRVRAVYSYEGRKTLHGAVLEDYICERLLTFRHGRKRDVLGRFGDTENHAGILYRKEALRHVYIEKNRGNQSARGHHQCRRPVPQHEFQGASVKRDDGVEPPFRSAIEAPLLAL